MNITSVDQGFQQIESLVNLAKQHTYTNRTYRLERMYGLLDFFNHPEKSFRIIHVAGSKGKGSTARSIAGGIGECGFTVGVYASPHLVDYRERITMNGDFFSDELILRVMKKMFARLEQFEYRDEFGTAAPTTFEVLTLLALLIFQEAQCDWVILETGLGGRLDATNVVTPDMSVITALELEHTDVLGDTIESIAQEKGGIIKPGVPVVCGMQSFPEARETILSIAETQRSPVIDLQSLILHRESFVSTEGTTTKVIWSTGKQETLHLSIGGVFQGENALLALAALTHLFQPSPRYRKKIIKGIEKATLAGRCQVIARNPDIMIDGAHTEKSIQGVLETWNQLYPTGGILIFGAVEGKNHRAMAKQLIPHFTHIIISTPGTFKQSNPQGLVELFKELEAHPTLELHPAKALQQARELSNGKTPILVTGSFYMISEIVQALRKEEKEAERCP